MTHEEIRARLSGLLDGALAAPEREGVEAHLDRCPQCAAELRSLSATVELLRGLPEAEPPPGLAERALARIEADERPGGRLRPLLHPFGSWRERAALLVGSAAAVTAALVWIGQPTAPSPQAGSHPRAEAGARPAPATLAERLETEAGAIEIVGPVGAATLPESEPAPASTVSPDAAVDRALAAPLAFVEDWLAQPESERGPWLARVAARAGERGEGARIARGLRATGDRQAQGLAAHFAPQDSTP